MGGDLEAVNIVLSAAGRYSRAVPGDPIDVLRERCEREGQTAVAAGAGVSLALVNYCLNGKRTIRGKLLKHLGFERVDVPVVRSARR